MRAALWSLIVLCSLLMLGAARPSATPAHRQAGLFAKEVIIYTSIDEPYFSPLFKRFESETGIRVTAVTDAEASKTAGLAERIIAERDRPRCDVYWGNEVFRTITLVDAGCLSPFRPKAGEDVPARWRDAGDHWVAVGLRARVIVVSSRPQDALQVARIRGLNDLLDPALKGKIALANPAFGTTSGHMAALSLTLGDGKFRAWLKGLRANDARLLGGNGAVVAQVAAGNLLAGLTDNDDVAAAIADGLPVKAVIPDASAAGGFSGTLLVPTTLALVRGAPHEADAKRLIEFLSQPAVERELLSAKFLAVTSREAGTIATMDVDYRKAATVLKQAVETALTVLQGR